MRRTSKLLACLFALFPLISQSIRAAESGSPPLIQFQERDGALGILLNQTEVATYVYRDELVSRPYFAHVKTPGGIQVTRNYPPRKESDATDHPGIHTGIWLSFGDLSGHDYWRLKAKTEHVRFAVRPQGEAGLGTFTVLNRYLSTDGKTSVCDELCHYQIKSVAHGYLIEMSSEFRPGANELVFGDQEEMGVGIRVATPLSVDRKQGGRILDSAARKNGKEIWGQTAEWCDYAGTIDGKWVGLTVLTGPENFRPCWCHARDYGFLAMNPFGRQAFTKEAPSRIAIKPGEVFRLRYGVVIHESAAEADYGVQAIYQEFAKAKP